MIERKKRANTGRREVSPVKGERSFLRRCVKRNGVDRPSYTCNCQGC